jgi:WD40 repeat protein
VASGGADGVIRLWNISTGELFGEMPGHAGPVLCLDFSPDNRQVASGGFDGSLRIWDVATLKERERLKGTDGHEDRVVCVSFSHAGMRLAAFSWDQSLRVWDLSTNEKPSMLYRKDMNEGFVTGGCCFTPDDTQVVLGCDGVLATWDLAKAGGGKILASLGERIYAFKFSRDGKIVAVAGGELRGKQGGFLQVLTAAGEKVMDLRLAAPVLSVALTLNAKFVVTGGLGSPDIRMWSIPDGKERAVFRGHGGDLINSIAVTPDGKTLVSGGSDGVARIWEIPKLE